MAATGTKTAAAEALVPGDLGVVLCSTVWLTLYGKSEDDVLISTFSLLRSVSWTLVRPKLLVYIDILDGC